MYEYLGDTGIKMYDLLSFMSFIPVLIFNFSQFSKKKLILSRVSRSLLNNSKRVNNINRFETIFTLVEIYIISTFQYSFTSFINTAFGNLFNTGPNYYGLLFITPIILVFVFFFLGIDIFKQMDLITPAFPLALIPIKLACFCLGCCHGKECSFGFYNNMTDRIEFPVQLVEAGTALLLFVFLMLIRKKAKDGTLFPIYLVAYSATRFFSEFLRYEDDVIWILKKYHLLCLIGIIVGIIEIFLVTKHKDKLIWFLEHLKKSLHNYAVKNGIIKNKNIVHHKKKKNKR